jgi:hypothetical protein
VGLLGFGLLKGFRVEMLTPIDQLLDKLEDLRTDEMYVYPFLALLTVVDIGWTAE